MQNECNRFSVGCINQTVQSECNRLEERGMGNQPRRMGVEVDDFGKYKSLWWRMTYCVKGLVANLGRGSSSERTMKVVVRERPKDCYRIDTIHFI